VIVRLGLRHVSKAEPLVQRESSMVLQTRREGHFLLLRVRQSNGVTEDARTNSAALVGRLDLDLAGHYGVRVLDQLDHAYALVIDLDAVDAPARPTFSAMSQVPSFIPAAPRGDEQVPIHGSAQLLERWSVLRSSWNQVMSHSLAPRSAAAAR
jgi:hypothetical protein